MEQVLALRFAAEPAQLKTMREQVRLAALARGWPDKLIADLLIAINEACTNIIEHAYGRGRAGEIALEILNNESELEVVLTDFAPPIDLAGLKGRALDDVRPGGLGTHFMQELMDHCVYAHAADGSGNVLRMRKHLGR